MSTRSVSLPTTITVSVTSCASCSSPARFGVLPRYGGGHHADGAGLAEGLQIVVADVDQARRQLAARGVEVSEVDAAWGRFVYFADPDGNTWSLQQLPPRG